MAQKRVRLQRVRKSAGFTQEELAHRLGMHVSSVQRWEIGETEPSAWMQPKLAKLLHVTRAQLVRLLESEPLPQGDQDATLNDDDQRHMVAALQDARRYLDESVAEHFNRQLDVCAEDDGNEGPTRTLPAVLGVVSIVHQHAREVKPKVRRMLLNVGARGAEFAGWLYRDASRPEAALYWRDRAVEWAQEAGDWSMPGYILLKKSQSAWDDRDGLRMLTLAQAAQNGPWQLSSLVRAEIAQQEARALAMTDESRDHVTRKLDQAWTLYADATPADREANKLGRNYSESMLLLQTAICHGEAGDPLRSVEIYSSLLGDERFSYRDRGYFRSLMAGALALAGEPDRASESGREALIVGRTTSSQRTLQEVNRVCFLLQRWRTRPTVKELTTVVELPPSVS